METLPRQREEVVGVLVLGSTLLVQHALLQITQTLGNLLLDLGYSKQTFRMRERISLDEVDEINEPAPIVKRKER